jgi:hypothetical protein
LVAVIGTQAWGRRTGIASGLILGTSIGYYIFSRIVLTDMVFTVLLTATFACIMRALLGAQERPGLMRLGYGLMGLAIMTKGLIGLAFPVLTVGAFLLLARDRSLLHRLECRPGIAIFLLVTAPWHIAVGWQNAGFFWFYFINEHVLRFVAQRHVLDYAPMPVATFLAMAGAWMLPWSIFLPAAAWRHRPRLRATTQDDRVVLFLWCWVASVLGFFALTPSRLEYYSMPAFPALAILIARYWATWSASPRRARWLLAGGAMALCVLAAALLPVAWLFPRMENVSFYNMLPALDAYSRDIQYGILSGADVYTVPSYEEIVPLMQWAGLAIGLGAALAAWAALRRQPALAMAWLVAGMLVTLWLAHSGIIAFEPHRSIARLADVVRRESRPGDSIIIDGPYENFASVAFYTDRRARVLEGVWGDLEFGSRYPEAKDVFLGENEFGEVWRGDGRVFLFSDSPTRIQKLERLGPPPVVLGRSGKNWLFSNR